MDSIPIKIITAFGVLLEATNYAADVTYDRWDFAVSIQLLQDTGCTESDLRWLVCKRYVEHAIEITSESHEGRVFCPIGELTFSSQCCFVLTNTGIDFARSVLGRCQHTESQSQNSCSNNHVPSVTITQDVPSKYPFMANGNEQNIMPSHSCSRPTWNADERTLHFDNQVVKQYKWHAANQEAILNAFEEEGWPRRIDDPLPPHPEQDSKRRLSDTIKGLNKKQLIHSIRFHGDGTGEGIIWEQNPPLQNPPPHCQIDAKHEAIP